jgi:hypothetical protein
MVKNTLEIARKMKRHHQGFRVAKRQIIIKIGDLQSNQPDISLGTYQVKANSAYTLLSRVELPRQTSLYIDVWGMNPKLQRINSCKIVNTVKDVRFNFHTYPKTRFIFFTFKLVQEDEISDLSPTQYVIQYLYIETKFPLARGVTTPDIPVIHYPQESEYDIECHPKNLMEMDLVNPLIEFSQSLPINMKIFDNSLISYLLKREAGPHYMDALKRNIAGCNVPLDISSDEGDGSNPSPNDLVTMREQITKLYEKLEKKLTTVDQLIEHKHSIEHVLDKPDNSVTTKCEYESKINFLQKTKEALNLKRNYIQNLMEIVKSDDKNLLEKDTRNLSEIFNYYENRILEDTKIIADDLLHEQNALKSFQLEILYPHETKTSHQQNSLDEIVLNYRKQQSTCLELKSELDSLIAKFILLWYHWVNKINIKAYLVVEKINSK